MPRPHDYPNEEHGPGCIERMYRDAGVYPYTEQYVEPAVGPYPDVEDFDPQEWKLLFMMLVENRGGVDLAGPLTPYGAGLLEAVKRKLAIRVVGVKSMLPVRSLIYQTCETCGQPILAESLPNRTDVLASET